jgi:parallel beta-helix repeat protein
MKSIVLTMALMIVFIGTLGVSTNVHKVEASGTIYIKADGSIDPSTANITSADNVTYTFTDNIYESIVVQRNNITIDGASYKLEGTGSGIGISISSRQYVTVRNVLIKSFDYGIYGGISLNNTISGNSITNNTYGIYLNLLSINNTISGNNVANNTYGVWLSTSSNNNIISGNNVTANNDRGIMLDSSSNNNIISGNNVTNNTLYGIFLILSDYNNISENNVTNNNCGIVLGYLTDGANNNIISGNIVANNGVGIWLDDSLNNNISGNNVTANNFGIVFYDSSNNIISGNNVPANNICGIDLEGSSSNYIYHNNFVDNPQQVYPSDTANVWDNGYPSGGNYWSNYTGVDLDPDGIGDTEHVIDANNTDNYPLMGMFSDFKATSEHHVQTVSNSTISDFQFNGTAVSFNVSGGDGTIGFCRILIPTALMNATYRVFINGTEILPSPEPLPCSNSTHSYLYFTYNHSTQEVIIIPEFPIWTLMIIILIMLTVATAIYKRRLLKTPIP